MWLLPPPPLGITFGWIGMLMANKTQASQASMA